jgi:hypothetical protein
MATALTLAAVLVIASALEPARVTAAVGLALPNVRATRPRGTAAHLLGPRAPTRPPLVSSAGDAGEEEAGVATPAEADPLVSNGLASPSCRGWLAGELSSTEHEHCETSGFIAAPAPTGDYGIDVHIDTGLLGLSPGGLLASVQDLFVTPLWMVLVWAVHALIVMLEWSYTIDLLDSAASGGLARGLRQAQVAFTQPWLALVLAIASVLALYQGLIRRRVAQTLGEVLLMTAMMVAGLWLIVDPTGTLGALGQWANQASLGTLAVAARGTPTAPGRALGTSLETVFAAAIEGPWCYMEFGDVGWCREPARLDPTLRSAGLAIASHESAEVACASSTCTTPTRSAQALANSVQLLRDARSNGAIFLALPANGVARNSINEQGSLLRAICQSSNANDCHGASAAEAEFRTGGQTRVAGLLLIAAGLLGMLLLLGFMTVRLLAASIFSLLYLLLAPAIVLAPAFGESGRALFRRWAGQLLGAVFSKLIFSFLLGVVLAVLAIISDLATIGWWTQWLLMSAFWWGAYFRRHQALGVIGGAVGRERGDHRSVVRRVGDVLETRKAAAAVRWVQRRRQTPAPEVVARTPSDSTASGSSSQDELAARVAGQAWRSLEHEHRDASSRAKGSADAREHIGSMRSRLERVRAERGRAQAGGDRRRTARLTQRALRIEAEIEREQGALTSSRRVARTTRNAFARDNVGQRERFLDEQAALPSSTQAKGRAQRRDYPALGGLVGHARREYEQLDPPSQRAARLEIDRELALRSEARAHIGGLERQADEPELAPSSRRPTPASRKARAVPEPRRAHDSEPSRALPESPVMHDVREVAAGRKRQLGIGRP